MRHKKIEKTIFNVLMLLPLILVLVYFVQNFANLWGNHIELSNSIVLSNFNQIMANFNVSNTFTQPIYYFLHNIFGMEETISNILACYFIYLIIVELLHILYDLFIFIPKVMRSLLNRGMKE